MNHFQFVAIRLTISLILGILSGYYFPMEVEGILFVYFLLLITTGYFIFVIDLKVRLLPDFCLVSITVLSGMLAVSLQHSFRYTDQIFSGREAQDHSYILRVREELNSSPYYDRYIGEVKAVDQFSSGGRLLCRVRKDSLDLKMNDVILVRTRPVEIPRPLNPNQFNYSRHMLQSGISHQLTLNAENTVIISRDLQSLKARVANIRHLLIAQLDQLEFQPAESTILKALLLGYRKDFDQDLMRNFKQAGAMHILAISGLHVGILLFLLQYLLQPLERLWHGQTLKLLICVMTLWGFALISGLSPSVVRAVSMFSLMAYAIYLNRPGSTFNVLALSAFFGLLLFNPLMLFQLGFQLSYTAVLSILWFYPRMTQYIRPENLFLRKAWQLTAVGLSAQAGVLPLTLYYFGEFPGLFFLSNLIIVPLLGPILGLGFLVLLLSLFAEVPRALFLLLEFLITAMKEVVDWIAEREIFLVQHIYFDHVHLVLSVLILIQIGLLLQKFNPRRVQLVLGCCIAMQIWNLLILTEQTSKQQLTIAHITGSSVVLYQNGGQLYVLTNRPQQAQAVIRDFRRANPVGSVIFGQLLNSYTFGEQRLLVVDKDSPATKYLPASEVVLLTHSPTINLERYLRDHRPDMIVADGSNYYGDASRWKKSCRQYNIPFYHTAVGGAVVVNLNPSPNTVH